MFCVCIFRKRALRAFSFCDLAGENEKEVFTREKVVFARGKVGGGSDLCAGKNGVYAEKSGMFARGSRTARECYFIFWCLKFGLEGELLSDF